MSTENFHPLIQPVAEKIIRFPSKVQDMFLQLRRIVYSVAPTVEEKLWAGLPSYYHGNAFVRLIPFKDHINIEAAACDNYRETLSQYEFTSKGMLQIYTGQEIPLEILTKVFRETF